MIQIQSIHVGEAGITITTQEFLKWTRSPPPREVKPGDQGWERYVGKAKRLLTDNPCWPAGELLGVSTRCTNDQEVEVKYVFSLRKNNE